MSDHEPRTGFSPHGTPMSSLNVTSSSSEGVPVAQPKRALPAMPALRAKRERSGSPPASSHSESSEHSGSTDTSVLRRQILSQRLEAQARIHQAAIALAQTELAMTELQEEELLEQGSKRSDCSRSSRGASGKHARALRDRELLTSMQVDSINRLKASAQVSGNLQPVEDVGNDDDNNAEAIILHCLHSFTDPPLPF